MQTWRNNDNLPCVGPKIEQTSTPCHEHAIRDIIKVFKKTLVTRRGADVAVIWWQILRTNVKSARDMPLKMHSSRIK